MNHCGQGCSSGVSWSLETMYPAPSWPHTSSLPCFAPQRPQLSREQCLWRGAAGRSLFLWNEFFPSSTETVSSCLSQVFLGPAMPGCLGDPAHTTAPSHGLWIPCKFPVPHVISMMTRASGVAVVCGKATVSLRLGAAAEASSRSVTQALQGKLWVCPHCLGLCKQPERAWPSQFAYQPC